ncbi:MAG: protein kinase [Verrucomicrobia bacterium]|nr:protein kinase [Verrucomicrobiota bacterium]
MSSNKHCLSCGGEFQSDNPTGLCRHCLSGLLSPEDDHPSQSSLKHEHDKPNLVGTTIAQYEVKRLIAFGGMGAVYEAFDQKKKRLVALKRMHDSMAWSPASIVRFHGEAKAASELSHPNIVPIIEIGEDQQTPFYTMKLIVGHSLADEKGPSLFDSQKGKPDADRSEHEVQVASRIAKIAQAIYHAHSHAILHRDIKPSNILIDQKGEPYITDFGLAKKMTSDIDLTQTGMMVGTPDYMAPEQIRDDLGPASVATDIYSLGTVLYQQLSGSPPFRADSHVKIFQNIINTDPTPPTLEGTHINPDLSLICLKCLQKDPKDRYASALEFAEELERWINREPLTVKPESPQKRIARTIKRHPVRVTVATFIILLGLSILGQRELNTRTIRSEQAQTRLINENLRELVTRNRLDRAEELFLQSDSTAAIANLAAVVRDHPPKDQARDHLVYLMSSIKNRRFPLRVCPPLPHEDDIGQLAFHPNGRHLATASFDGNIRIWDLSNGQLAIPEIVHGGQVYRVQFSPDGKHILAASFNNTARIWNVKTGKPVSDWMVHSNQIHTARYSPEGRWIVTTGIDRKIKLWDARIGAQIPVEMDHPLEEWGVHVAHFVPNRDQLLTSSVKGKIRIWTIPEGRLIKQIDTGENYLTEILIDPAGERFVNLGKARVGVWRIKDWKKEFQLEQDLAIWTGQFSADGKRLITASQDRHDETRVWDISSGKLNRTLEFKGIRGIGLIAKPANSRWFSIAKDQVFSWSDQDGRSTMPPIQVSGTVKSITVDPFNQRIAVVTTDKRVHVWTTPNPNSNFRTSPDQQITHACLAQTGDSEPQLFGWNSTDQSFTQQSQSSQRVKRFKEESITEVDSIVRGHHGNLLAIRCLKNKDYVIAIHNLKTGMQQFYDCKMGSLQPSFSPDDRLLFYEEDHDQVRVIHTDTGKQASELLSLGKQLSVGAFSRDGSEIYLSYNSDQIGRWSLESNALIDPIIQPGGTISNLKHAPHEDQIATAASDGILRCWRTSGSPKLLWKTKKLGQITKIEYSNSGEWIATATASGNIALWNSSNGQKLEIDLPHDDQVFHFQFTPEDQVLMTVTANHLIHFWNPLSGLSISEPLAWEGLWQSVTLSIDGKLFSRTLANGQVEIRPTPGTDPLGPPPEWLTPFTEALVGIRLQENDETEPIHWDKRIKTLSRIDASPAEDPFANWAKAILESKGFTPYFEERR